MLLGNVMLVILVEPAIERYMAVSSVLPSAWLAVAIQRFLVDISPS
jgi:TctA family transporter